MKDEELETAWGAFAATRTAEAFERLWNAGRGLAMRLAWMAVGDPDAAEDVVAALFARLWCDGSRALPAGLSARQALVRWTLDEARTANRRRWRQRGREAALEPLAASLPSDAAGPRAHAASRETAEQVRTLIHTLPEKYREALIACEIQELTLAEAARSLGRPERTVQAQVRRGKALLERKLRGAGLTLSLAGALAAVGEHASAATTTLTAAGIVERSAALVQNAGPIAMASAGLSKAWLIAASVAVVVLGTVGAVAWSGGANDEERGASTSVVASAETPSASAPNAPATASPSSEDAELEEAAHADEARSAESSRSATLAELIEETEPHAEETAGSSTGNSEEEIDGPVAEWTGRVVSAEGGIPIAGARVGQLEAKEGIGAFATEPLTPEATFSTTTDADGLYTLRIPAPDPAANSFLVFVAEAPAHGSLGAMTFSALVQPTGNRMDFELPAAGRITGRVVDGATRPLPGTTVGYFILNEPDFTRIMTGPVNFATGWTTTGEDGGFVLDRLPQGWNLSVPVFAPGFPATVRDDIAVGVEDLTIIVEGAAARITGRVLAGDEPAASVTVTAVVPPEPNTMQLQRTLVERWTARTGEDGRFELGVPAAGRYQVLASSGEDSAPRMTATEVEVKTGGTAEVELSFPADAVVQGRAIEAETGAPVAGLGVSMTPYFRDLPDGRTERIDVPERTEVRTGADGLFTLHVPLILKDGVGSASFFFDPPPGWIPAGNDLRISGRTLYLSKLAPGATVPVDVTLKRSIVLRGVTVDAAGTPVPRAGVEMRGRQTATAISDDEGRFEIAVPPGADTALTAMTPGLYGDALVSVPSEGAVPELTLVMRETGIVVGTVLDADGKPAEGLFVQLWKNFAGGRTSSAVGTPSPVKTGEDGTFRFHDVPPGEASVRVSRDASSMTELNLPVSIDLAPGAILDDVVVRLRAAERMIDGVVSDTDGVLLKDIEVYAMVDLPEGGRPWNSKRVRTGGDGYFVIEGIPDGKLSVVWFQHEDYESLPLSERSVEDAPFNVTMKRRREVVVRIVDAASGAPQARAAGRLLRQDGWGWQVVEGFNGVTPEKGDGVITMGRLDDNTYLFQAAELDAAGKPTGRRGQVKFKPSDLPGDAPLDVRVSTGSPAGGKVVMMDGGAPVEGAVVHADVPTDNWNERQPPDARFDVEAVVTDSAGVFRFPSLGPGEHRLRVEKPGLFETVPRWIVVQPGGESESVTIKMGVKKE